jgi:hypothetical protein
LIVDFDFDLLLPITRAALLGWRLLCFYEPAVAGAEDVALRARVAALSCKVDWDRSWQVLLQSQQRTDEKRQRRTLGLLPEWMYLNRLDVLTGVRAPPKSVRISMEGKREGNEESERERRASWDSQEEKDRRRRERREFKFGKEDDEEEEQGKEGKADKERQRRESLDRVATANGKWNQEYTGPSE